MTEVKNISLRTAFGFFLVGGAATALHYVLTVFFAVGLKLPVVAASTIGFVISAIFNYLLNARITFRSARSHTQAIPRFVITAAIGMLLNLLLLAAFLTLGMHPAVAQVLATIGVLIWNYCINALWTFKKQVN